MTSQRRDSARVIAHFVRTDARDLYATYLSSVAEVHSSVLVFASGFLSRFIDTTSRHAARPITSRALAARRAETSRPLSDETEVGKFPLVVDDTRISLLGILQGDLRVERDFIVRPAARHVQDTFNGSLARARRARPR